MLGFLFRGLTAEPARGAALFGALTAEARRPSWYVEAEVSDSLDGRFAVLATITALALVRLERDADAGNQVSAVLTERFIQVMESEHRQLGLGDPTLGRTVRKLVGMLARRIELWRAVLAGAREWPESTRESLSCDDVSADALSHSMAALRHFSERLNETALADLEQGKIT